MKSLEQRIEDAADVLQHHYLRADAGHPRSCSCNPRSVARQMLEAADREPPKWPSDETIELILPIVPAGLVSLRDTVRAALLADPIIKAASALARDPASPYALDLLIKAVKDAGL